MITEGGFPAGPASTLGIRSFTVPGTNVDFPAGLAPFAAPLLLWVASQIHHRVEKLHDGWCWGYSFRNVRGSGSVLSDHSGGVAIDINAPAHPRGVRGTWSSSQVAEIRRILAEANAHSTVVAWGHDFRTTDDMHFAARGTKSAVIAAGQRLNAPKEWWDDVTRDEARTLIDNRIEAAIPAIAKATAEALLASTVTDPVSGDEKTVGTIVRYASWRMQNTIRSLGGKP